MRKYKAIILYRVIQHWRAPIFEKLATNNDIEIWHGSDFTGTKVKNYKGLHKFSSKQLLSVKIKMKTSNGYAYMPFSPFLFPHLIKANPDIIICEGASNLLNDIVAFAYAKIFRKKYIWWSLGQLQNRKLSIARQLLNGIIKYIEKRSAAIISYSTIGKQYFLKIGVPEDKIFVAVNVVDTDKRLLEISKINKDEVYTNAHKKYDFVVLFVGALTKEKRVDLLLEAFSNFIKKYDTKATLNIIGNGGYKESLLEIIEKQKIPNVDFKGEVVEGVSKYFLESDVFVLPGLGGLAVSDALVHGLPVITSIGDGCEKDLIDGTNGIIDEEMTVEKLTEYLFDLYNNKAKLEKMKLSAIHTINTKYNVTTYIKSIINCIEYTLQK